MFCPLVRRPLRSPPTRTRRRGTHDALISSNSVSRRPRSACGLPSSRVTFSSRGQNPTDAPSTISPRSTADVDRPSPSVVAAVQRPAHCKNSPSSSSPKWTSCRAIVEAMASGCSWSWPTLRLDVTQRVGEGAPCGNDSVNAPASYTSSHRKAVALASRLPVRRRSWRSMRPLNGHSGRQIGIARHRRRPVRDRACCGACGSSRWRRLGRISTGLPCGGGAVAVASSAARSGCGGPGHARSGGHQPASSPLRRGPYPLAAIVTWGMA